MKHLSYTTLFLLMTCCLLTGCGKFLEQAPNAEEDKDYIFEDYTRTQRYLDMLYYYMPPAWAESGKFDSYPGLLESATDMAEYSTPTSGPNMSFNLGNWRHVNASAEVNRWDQCYNQIRRCFMVLENIEGFHNEPTGRKETMKAECYFFIGFYYNELLKRYGGVPLVDKTLSIHDDLKFPRAGYDQTVAFIVNYLDKALELAPAQWDLDNIGRVDQAWVLALKSQVQLFAASPLNNPSGDKEKWIAAAATARRLIDFCKETGYYFLYPDWQNIFMRDYPDKRPEIIIYRRHASNVVTFKSKLISGQQATPGDGFWGGGSNNPTQNFVDRFEVLLLDAKGKAVGTTRFNWNDANHVANIYKNRDPRFYYTVLYNGRFWIKRNIGTWRDGSTYGPDINPKNTEFSRTGYYLRKFWPRECYDKQTPGSGQVSEFYIRLAEIYLNYAEAMNEAFGPYTDGLGLSAAYTAADAVNEVRARLVCPATKDIKGETDPYYYVLVERNENPDFPVLPQGMPPLPTNLSQDQARERIRNERVIELCFEDKYFYDIQRWKAGAEHIGGSVYGVDVIKSGETYTYSRKKIEDRTFDESRMYRYPIPTDEVNTLGISQNPGW